MSAPRLLPRAKAIRSWSSAQRTVHEVVAGDRTGTRGIPVTSAPSPPAAVASRLPEQSARRLVNDFLALDIPTHTPPGLYQRAYELAARYNRANVYDMCYLALSERFSCDLLTLDKHLYNVARWDFPNVKLVQ